MNWADLLAPRYHLSRRPDGSLLETGHEVREIRVLAFDRETRRFVTIHWLPPRQSLEHSDALSIGERVYLAGRISHPGLFNVTDYGERQDCLFYVTEVEEGEPLPSYLGRVRSLPLRLAIDLAVQLAALLRHLAGFPRILAHLTAEDLLVSVSPGQSLCLRFAGLGLNREEVAGPLGLEGWVRRAASLLWDLVGVSLTDDPQLKFSAQGASALLDPFREFLDSAQAAAGNPPLQVFRDLERDLHRQLVRFLEMLEPRPAWPGPDECIALRPRSFLAALLIQQGFLPPWQDHNFEFAPELYCGHARFALAARDVRSGADVAFQILPPDALIGETGLEPLYRKLGHPGPKEDSPVLRTFFLRSEEACTFFAEEAVHGFNLANLLERRATLSAGETCRILSGMAPVFRFLERAGSTGDLLAPWHIHFDFEPSATPEDFSRCLTSWDVREWPNYRLRLRLGPTMADFTRPQRSEWDEIVHRLEQDFPSPAGGIPPLDLSFAALAVYLLEYRRYHNLLGSGDPRPRAAVSSGRLHRLVAGLIPARPDRADGGRERFVEAVARQLATLTESSETDEPCSPGGTAGAAAAGIPLELGAAATAAGPSSTRQHRVTLLNRLLRRDRIMAGAKRRKPAK